MAKSFFLVLVLFLNTGILYAQGQIRLTSPANNSVVESATPALHWEKSADTNIYLVNVFSDRTGRNEVAKLTVRGNSCSVPKGYLVSGSQYYWRVTPRKNNILGRPSQMWSFTVFAEDTEQAAILAAEQPRTMVPGKVPIASQETRKQEYSTKPEFKKHGDENKRRRVLGEHIFPTTVLFPSPIPSARFGFAQGFGTMDGKYLWISDDGDIKQNKYRKYGFSEIFDGGMVFTDFAALDLNANLQLDGGMDNSDFITVEANPNGDLRVGPVFYYQKEGSKLLLSFSPRLYYSRGVSISAAYGIEGMYDVLVQKLGNDPGFWSFYDDTAGMGGDSYNLDTIDELFKLMSSTYVANNLTAITGGFTKNIMKNTSALAISPSLGVAYPITPYLGFQGFTEYQKITEKTTTKTESSEFNYSKFNFGGALSMDCRHFINFPLGIVLEYSRETRKGDWGDSKILNNYGFGAYYQGIGDIQLGLFLKTTQSKYKFTGYDDSYSQTLAMFNITYFF